jgi:hypothetical protein
MELLKEVANIAGKPGLFRVLKPSRAGVVVEALDESKKKEMIAASAKVSILNEISVYTEDVNISKPLSEIFNVIREQMGENIDFDFKTASNAQVFSFFEKVMPDFDKERVYANDIKKIFNWYKTLTTYFPEVFTEIKSENIEQKIEPEVEAPKAASKKKK